MKLPEDERMGERSTADSWELVREVPKRTYLVYPEKNVPLTRDQSRPVKYKYDEVASAQYTALKFSDYQLNRLAEGKMSIDTAEPAEFSDRFYLKLLPPSSFVKTAEYLPLKKSNGTLYINQNSGFRLLTTGVRPDSSLYYRVDYHKGIDIVDHKEIDIVDEATSTPGTVVFKAPESGWFYLIAQSGRPDEMKVKVPLSGGGEEIVPDDGDSSMYDSSFGNIGVLITKPENPREGRVYLFCHMEDTSPTVGQNAAGRYSFYTNGGFKKANGEPLSGFPVGLSGAMVVEAGTGIGHIGNEGLSTSPGTAMDNNGDGGTHIHLEVWEYFEIVGDGGGKWRRVDPMSVFYGERNERNWITLDRSLENETVYMKQAYVDVVITENDEDTDPDNNTVDPKKYDAAFRKWYLRAREEDEFFVP